MRASLRLPTSISGGLSSRLGGRDPMIRYTIYSGTNTWQECELALRLLWHGRELDAGPHIQAYERRFAEAAGTEFAFSFASGRMGLYAMLEALKIGPGDEVIVPAFTCVVVPNAILYRGARPVYVDIGPRTFNIDVQKIEEKITHKTKAILAQHTFGLVCDIDAIAEIAERYGITVIEDGAHALGAVHGGRAVGSLTRVAFFSTDHSKVISTSTGGIVTTSDPDLARTLAAMQAGTPFLSRRRIRAILATFVAEYLLFHPGLYPVGKYAHGVLSKLRLWPYFYDELSLTKPARYPYPARLSNAQAQIGLSQLALLDANLTWRRRLAKHYEAWIGAYQGLLNSDGSNHAFLRYTFLVDHRDAWEKHFSPVLDMGVWFRTIAGGRDHNLDEIGYAPGSCPVAEEVARHCVNLPTHQRIRRPDLLVERLRRARERPDPRLELHFSPASGAGRPT